MARPSGAGRSTFLTRPDRGRLSLGRGPSPFRHDEGERALPLIVVNVVGLVALALGVFVLRPDVLASSLGGALGADLAQLPTTFHSTLSVGLGTAMDLIAGAVLVRLVRWSPYGSVAEAALGGLIGAVAKDTVLLLALGGIGQFQPLVLALIDLALIGGGFLLRPFVQGGEGGPRRGSALTWILPLVLWSVPVIVLLASPIVPFADGLANQVAPIEHIRAYASYADLAVSPSPLYGPAGLSLGYLALVGSVTTLTGLPATLAVAAFALPLSILLAAAGYHVARSVGGPAAGYWSLLTVPLTLAFLRLPDASATLLALPLASAALTLALGESRGASETQWLAGRSRPTLIAAAVGATVLVHPIVGAMAAATVVLIGLLRPSHIRRAVIAGTLGALIVALPQVAIMSGVVAPAWIGLPAWPVGLLIAAWLGGPGPRRGDLAETLPPARSYGLILAVLAIAVLIAAIGGAVALAISADPRLPSALAASLGWAIVDYPVLLVVVLVGVVFIRSSAPWRLIGTGVLVGLAAVAVGLTAPTDTRLGLAIHTEVPEVAAYWLPWLLALAGGIGLAELWSREAWPPILRGGVAVVILIAAVFPYRPGTSAPAQAREYSLTESVASGLQEAEHGYWTGFADSRAIVGTSGTALIAAIRTEQAAGRLGATTAVLHIAPSFTMVVATPLAVFTGVMETTATLDPTSDIPADGGRLLAQSAVPQLLGPGYPYLVIEGYAPGTAFDAEAAAAGYVQLAAGDGWRLLALRGR